MSTRFLMIALLLSFVTDGSAQILRGRITDNSGTAVQYATVYISELKQGTVANTRGDYELRLPPGKYEVVYQSLGYGQVFATINISNNTVTRDVVLPLEYYVIPEVRISASGENPAYSIMRKAIGLAPYYLNNISRYKADVYLKGTMIFTKIPKIIKRQITIEARNSDGGGISSGQIKENYAYIMESFNEIEFTAPNKYNQKVLSINSTMPDAGDGTSPMDLIQASFYEPLVANMAISPLSPQAFSHYTFSYEGASLQGNNSINKIKVTPKRKSQQLFEGYIYIIDDLWCLHSVDLVNDNIAGKIRVKQLYVPVQDETWMPVSHAFTIDVSILGIRGEAGYSTSVKYNQVEINKSLKRPDAITSQNLFEKPDTEQPVSKTQEKLEEILQKDNLTNRDMVKLSKLMEKTAEEAKPDSVKNSLEVKETTVHTFEEGASDKDSAYWASVRPIPLSEIEMQSVRERDSVKALQKSLIRENNPQDSLKKSGSSGKKGKGTLKDITLGNTWNNKKGTSFYFSGLIAPGRLSFNSVDGFIYGAGLRLNNKVGKNNFLVLDTRLRYAFSRSVLMWNATLNYSFSGNKLNQMYLKGGKGTTDFSNGGSVNLFLNSLSSLFFKENILKLYESEYYTIGYRKRIANGLDLDLSAGVNRRITLPNYTNFSFTSRSELYSENIPQNSYILSGGSPYTLPFQHLRYEIVTNVTFIPRQKYSIRGTTKVPMGSDWPTFTFRWEHGISYSSGTNDPRKNSDMLKLTATKNYDLGAMSELRWIARAGGYLDNRDVSYYDFFHFNTQSLPVLIDDYQDAFRLSDYYSLSTPEVFAETHIKYTTPYLLLKYLPGLSKTLMRENLSLSVLITKNRPAYFEAGYSISELLLLGEAGIFVGFDNLKYRCTGARLVLRFN